MAQDGWSMSAVQQNLKPSDGRSGVDLSRLIESDSMAAQRAQQLAACLPLLVQR